MYGLVDWDPDGIAILSTYKYGSYRLAHEDVAQADGPTLSLPDLRWLGIRGHNISRTPVGESGTDTSAMSRLQGLMKLTPRDRKKAMHMLEWDLCADEGQEQGWRQELQNMLMLNIKAEMQILNESQGGLISWVSKELDRVMERAWEQPVDSGRTDDAMLL